MIGLLQISIDISGGAGSPVDLNSTFYLVSTIISLILAGIIAIYILRWLRLRKARRAGGKLSTSVLRVRLPRFLSEDGMKAPELREVQEDIAVAETFFAAIGGMTPQKGFSAWWNGRTDYASVEIVVENGLISFYACRPL